MWKTISSLTCLAIAAALAGCKQPFSYDSKNGQKLLTKHYHNFENAKEKVSKMSFERCFDTAHADSIKSYFKSRVAVCSRVDKNYVKDMTEYWKGRAEARADISKKYPNLDEISSAEEADDAKLEVFLGDIDKNDQDQARDLFSYKDREALDTLVAKVNNARDSCYNTAILPIKDFYKSSTKYDRSDWVSELVYPEKLYR